MVFYGVFYLLVLLQFSHQLRQDPGSVTEAVGLIPGEGLMRCDKDPGGGRRILVLRVQQKNILRDAA